MFDSHAHIGDIVDNAFVCTEGTDLLDSACLYRSWALGTIPEGKESDIDKLYQAARMGGHIGEIGVDKRYPDIDRQIAVFKDALAVAKECGRLAVIHTVRTYGIVYGILRDMKIEKFIMHGYTGSVDMARKFISLGGIISLSPRIAKARAFPEILTLPFVTETDMKTGEEEQKALQKWNGYLSMITGRDIEKESEDRIKEVIC